MTPKDITPSAHTKPAVKPEADGKPLASPAVLALQAPAADTDTDTDSVPSARPGLKYIVGIGASAGGLEAFEAFFRACPANTGMAFVLVSHLDPGHESLLTEILQRCTTMPVVQALDQQAVVADHVYVIPPNRDMAILNAQLQLSLPDVARGLRMPIDGFFRTLAEDQGERAIGIILSGTATDGTQGLRAILGAGGLCVVQDPDTAKYNGMPLNAINAGFATHVMAAEKMPAMLLDIAHGRGLRWPVEPIVPDKVVSAMNQILLQLRSSTGHDFSLYKKSTISRRIERRMAQQGIDDLAGYARFLKQTPSEAKSLFKDLLINVTSFFRDPEAFVALKARILPLLLADKPAGYVFRVWVAGCASGEEAYSIAMVLLELLDEFKARGAPEFSIQIFATDLDDDAITLARAGRYPPNIAQDLTPERLRRFFTQDQFGYKVRKDIRDPVVFAVQSVIKDPPFTKLDLLSCRNLMIYLEAEQQKRLIPTFHYALKPGGVLFLSPSESITQHAELFSTFDRKWKFYRAVHFAAASPTQVARYAAWSSDHRVKAPEEVMYQTKETNFDELTRRVLLQTYAPASVVTDLKGNMLYVYGDTGRYLRPAPGQATLNVIEMAREGLQLELHRVFLQAPNQGTPTFSREVLVKTNGGFSRVSVSVRWISQQSGVREQSAAPGADGGLLLLSFQDLIEPAAAAQPRVAVGRRGKAGKQVVDVAAQQRIAQLEGDLAYALERQQNSAEEQQAFHEELRSANEELQSTNEELQSANEELETAKEELQSLNEEMITVNAELNAKIELMSDIQDDFKNLIDSSNTGTLFIDNNLRIRRYTPAAVKVYRLIAGDIGRPLADIKSNLKYDDLLADVLSVLDTLTPIEREVCTLEGAWYLARIQPYRTLDNVIAGVVLTLTTVTEYKLASEAVERSEALLVMTQELAHLGSWEFDLRTRQLALSAETYRIHEVDPAVAPTLDLAISLYTAQARTVVQAAVQATLDSATPYVLDLPVVTAKGRRSTIQFRGVAIKTAGTAVKLIGTCQDISERLRVEQLKLSVEQLARELAEGIVDTVREPLLVLDSALQVVSAGQAFYQYFQVSVADTVGRKIYDLGSGQWNIPSLRHLLDEILPKALVMNDYVVEQDFPGIGARRLRLNARRIVTALGNTELILLAMVAIEPLE
jgi:two-component system CheB/CheR fusion protein